MGHGRPCVHHKRHIREHQEFHNHRYHKAVDRGIRERQSDDSTDGTSTSMARRTSTIGSECVSLCVRAFTLWRFLSTSVFSSHVVVKLIQKAYPMGTYGRAVVPGGCWGVGMGMGGRQAMPKLGMLYSAKCKRGTRYLRACRAMVDVLRTL